MTKSSLDINVISPTKQTLIYATKEPVALCITHLKLEREVTKITSTNSVPKISKTSVYTNLTQYITLCT